MLKELQFVRGAIARKDFDPTLTHFLIKDRRVWSFNGIISLSCPIQCELDIAPHGLQFLKALQACDEVTTVHMVPSGHLAIKSGKFRTQVDCVRYEEHKAPPPAGGFVELDGKLLSAVKKLEPFIGFDASRPWACGILFKGESAFATNNISAVEYWLGYKFPVTVNIPVQAVRELIRIDEEPLGLQLTEDQLTFYYAESRWLTTKLSALDWPNISGALDRLPMDKLAPVPEGIWDAVEKLAPFCDDMGRVHFCGGSLATARDATATVVELPSAPDKGVFNAKQLLCLRNVAELIDFDNYPLAVPFQGTNVRGMVAGLRA